mmetsp:Transcript_88143/g.121586  ORF Transcript_88143/g.121586 Transcript_88143/m.121586 type:complete len:155 (+) Transcript_88143:50-514(+)|eukprot:scaffold303104_cov36-Tisochrysis_lutea.AAC.2
MRALLLLAVLSRCMRADAAYLTVASPILRIRGGLDATWTPNGEGPAPFSTKARQQMGMDPSAMAGAPATGAGGGLQMGIIMLVVMYLANNWKVALAFQSFVKQLLTPVLKSMSARKEAGEMKAAAAAKRAEAAARKARRQAAAAKAKSKDDELD